MFLKLYAKFCSLEPKYNIRNARLDSVPKIVKTQLLSISIFAFWPFRDKHIFIGSLCHSLQVGMFCIIVSTSATGFGYLEVDLGVIVGSHWIHICSSLVKVSYICSLAID